MHTYAHIKKTCMCNVAISTVLLYCIVTLVRLSLVTNKGYLLTYLLTYLHDKQKGLGEGRGTELLAYRPSTF